VTREKLSFRYIKEKLKFTFW